MRSGPEHPEPRAARGARGATPSPARYAEFGRAGAEVVAETAAFVALSAARLDTGGQAIPYVSGWADAAPKEISSYAEAVHRIARVLERGLGLDVDPRERSAVVVTEPQGLVRSMALERTGDMGRVR